MAAAEEEVPLTGVGWAASPEAAPAGWKAITVTVDGAAANLGKGFGHKSGGFLCVSTGGAQAAPASVVTDVVVLSDRSPQPPGYSRAPEFPEPRTGVSRKKRLYVKLVPVEAAETAVLDIQLSPKSKALPPYIKIGEMGNFALWCKKGPVSKRGPPVPPPRNLSAALGHLSLHPQDRKGSLRRGAAQHEALSDSSNIYGLSAMDGVPFTLHPKFQSKLGAGSTALLAELNVKSVADIEKEYNYPFVVERTAAARLPPGVC
ncbi:PREDICTED: multivesicular body subunit 12A isoform X2 [Calidris pugnax]|uniref:multivesicular body subunit 12A isoform X1 n=1 Tax=Calidris pugnax TaxID=198806 RepID=UPI00071CAF50|nr:PREDICTED: multivesicular body subunit 12A isoform X1 [Calidris pugnax]XP_014795698.1 PREDICTED: multivesicular body subunit 12A isoform X2 [Calidris pugnax]